MTEAQEVYQGMILEVLKLRKKLQHLRCAKVLAKLASTKEKSAHLRFLQADLERHLEKTYRNNEEIDNLLEILEDLV